MSSGAARADEAFALIYCVAARTQPRNCCAFDSLASGALPAYQMQSSNFVVRGPHSDAGTESSGAGAADAELQCEQCFMAHFAQKSLCICFGGSWVVCSARDTKQQLSAPGSCPNAANTVAGAAAAELPLERCCVGARCAQKWWRICFGAGDGRALGLLSDKTRKRRRCKM